MSTATRATGWRCAGALSRARAPGLRGFPAFRAFPAVPAGLGPGASEPAGPRSGTPWLVSVTLPSYQTATPVLSAEPQQDLLASGRTKGPTGQRAGPSCPGERRRYGEHDWRGYGEHDWRGRGEHAGGSGGPSHPKWQTPDPGRRLVIEWTTEL